MYFFWTAKRYLKAMTENESETKTNRSKQQDSKEVQILCV